MENYNAGTTSSAPNEDIYVVNVKFMVKPDSHM